MASLRCPDHLVLRGIRTPHGNIFPDRAAFQPCFLQHHAIIIAQALSGNSAYVPPRHLNTAAVYIIETHQKINERRLSAARGSHNSHPLSLIDMKVEVLNQLLIRLIGKVDVFNVYPAV